MPNGYKIVRQSLVDDLEGEKKVCWETEILQDDDSGFTYEISRCLYFDTCKEHGYAEFCKVFCNHDWYAYGVLKHHRDLSENRRLPKMELYVMIQSRK